MENENPPGVVGVYVDKNGRAIVSVADFNPDGVNGMRLREGQEWRVRRKLAQAIVVAYCSPVISDALDDYDCEQIVGKLKGKMIFIPVNHET